MANQPPQAGVDPRLVQQVIQDASMMEQEGQTRVMISRQLFQQLQAALQTYYGNAKQVDKMFEAEQNLVYLAAKLEDQIEFGSGGIAKLGRKAKAVMKPPFFSPQGKAARLDDAAELLNRRKGRIIQKAPKKNAYKAKASYGSSRFGRTSKGQMNKKPKPGSELDEFRENHARASTKVATRRRLRKGPPPVSDPNRHLLNAERRHG